MSRLREVCKSPISCEHCGEMPDCFVKYDEGLAAWCPWCVYANSVITMEQLQEDELESLTISTKFYEQKIRDLRRKLLILGIKRPLSKEKGV